MNGVSVLRQLVVVSIKLAVPQICLSKTYLRVTKSEKYKKS